MQGAFNSPTIQECFELFVCSAPSQVPDPDHWARLVVALCIQGLKSLLLFAHRTWRYAVSDSSLGPSYRAKCSRPKKSELDPGHWRTCFATKLRIFFPPWGKPEKAPKRTKNTQNGPYSPEKVRFGPFPALFRTPKLLTKQFRPQRTNKIFFTFIIDNSLGSTFLRLKNRFSRRKIGYFPKKVAL